MNNKVRFAGNPPEINSSSFQSLLVLDETSGIENRKLSLLSGTFVLGDTSKSHLDVNADRLHLIGKIPLLVNNANTTMSNPFPTYSSRRINQLEPKDNWYIYKKEEIGNILFQPLITTSIEPYSDVKGAAIIPQGNELSGVGFVTNTGFENIELHFFVIKNTGSNAFSDGIPGLVIANASTTSIGLLQNSGKQFCNTKDLYLAVTMISDDLLNNWLSRRNDFLSSYFTSNIQSALQSNLSYWKPAIYLSNKNINYLNTDGAVVKTWIDILR